MSLDLATQWLRDADRLLITAGAGLTAAAGIDYSDEADFAAKFPALHRRGIRARYQMIGRELPPRLLWGFWASHVAEVRFGAAPSDLYAQLRTLVESREYFVMTSNVDQLFVRNGFSEHTIYTPQGDYGYYQCLTPCSREVWPSEEIITRALGSYDAESGEIDEADVPQCPLCDGPVFLNVYAGSWYVDDRYHAGLTGLETWLTASRAMNAKVAVLEIGAGYNTPGVIRKPSEQIVRSIPTARLIRVNPDHPDVPEALGDRALSLAMDAQQAIAAFTR